MPKIAAIILVGGEARRLQGQNKCDLKIGPKTCLEWTLELFEGQVEKTALSVGLQDRYNHAKSHQIIFDWQSQSNGRAVAFAILGSLVWANNAGFDAIITAPVDTPFLPKSYAATLIQHLNATVPTVCKTADGLQSLHAIWPVSCLGKLKTAILDKNSLKLSTLHDILNSRERLFKAEDKDRFLNINTEDKLKIAREFYSG